MEEDEARGDERYDPTTISLMQVHLHHLTAKKEVGDGARALATFWNEMAEAIMEFKVRIFSGDFNMALFQVVPEMRARGVAVNLAAWYPYQVPGEQGPRIDSMGVFLVGRCAGVRRIFNPSVISPSAVAEGPLPPAWKNVEQILRDAEGKDTGRQPYKLPRYSLGQTGRTLDKYQPKMEERMTKFLQWTFEPALEPDSPAVMK